MTFNTAETNLRGEIAANDVLNLVINGWPSILAVGLGFMVIVLIMF